MNLSTLYYGVLTPCFSPHKRWNPDPLPPHKVGSTTPSPQPSPPHTSLPIHPHAPGHRAVPPAGMTPHEVAMTAWAYGALDVNHPPLMATAQRPKGGLLKPIRRRDVPPSFTNLCLPTGSWLPLPFFSLGIDRSPINLHNDPKSRKLKILPIFVPSPEVSVFFYSIEIVPFGAH